MRITGLMLALVAAALTLAAAAGGSPSQTFTGTGVLLAVAPDGVPNNDVVFRCTASIAPTGSVRRAPTPRYGT